MIGGSWGMWLRLNQIQLCVLILGVISLGLIKLSVCFLLWHFLVKIKYRRFLTVWIVFIILWTTAFVLMSLLQCGKHFSAMFGTSQEYFDKCMLVMPAMWVYLGTDIMTELVTLLIPIPVVSFQICFQDGTLH